MLQVMVRDLEILWQFAGHCSIVIRSAFIINDLSLLDLKKVAVVRLKVIPSLNILL